MITKMLKYTNNIILIRISIHKKFTNFTHNERTRKSRSYQTSIMRVPVQVLNLFINTVA